MDPSVVSLERIKSKFEVKKIESARTAEDAYEVNLTSEEDTERLLI